MINPLFPSSIEVCHFTYSVYYTFLKYLYTDQVGGALDTDDLTGK